MKIVDRYLIRNFLGPFFITFLFSLFIILMQFLWKYVDDLVGKGLEWYIILELLFYASATFVSLALPLAVLLSSLMTFGNMGERYEIVAFKSAGISIGYLLRPLAGLVVLIAIFSFWFSNSVIPVANWKMKSLLYDIKEQKPALSINEGTFYKGFDNYVIRIGKKHANNEDVEDILIYDHSRHQGNCTMTYAKRGVMKMTTDKKYFLFTLYDGYYWDESRNTNSRSNLYPLSRARFKEQYKVFDLSSFEIQKSDDSFFKSSYQSMPLQELWVQADTLKMEIDSLREISAYSLLNILYFFNNYVRNDSLFDKKMAEPNPYVIADLPLSKKHDIYNYAKQSAVGYKNTVQFAQDDLSYRKKNLYAEQIEMHRKFTLAVACLLFFFIGAPLGSIIRKGGIGVPLVVTVLFFAFYFVISIIGEKVSKGSVIPVALGMWFSTIVLLPVCIFLTYKATVDASVLSAETYSKWLKKFKMKFSKKNEDITTVS